MNPKLVLQEIKKLYYNKRFDEALVMCRKLVARFPNNKDLKGLESKIAARTAKSGSRENSAGPSASPAQAEPSESTMYYTEQAEAGMNAADMDAGSASDDDAAASATGSPGGAEQLITKGVQLYEVQDYEQAVNAWKKALEIDPENTIARDYLSNVQAMMGGPEDAGSDAPGADAEAGIPDKNKLLEIYNEGLTLYKDKKFKAALEKWEFILKYYPGHRETQECIRKTQAALEKESEYTAMLNEAEQEFKSGDHAEAERKVLHLLIKAPHLDGAQKLKEAIEERKRQITEIRSLEIEETQPQHISSATDDEITRYFTPDAGGARKSEGRKVVKIVKPKKEKKFPIWTLVTIAAVVIVAVGGFFGWQQMQRRLVLDTGDAPLQILVTQDDPWDSPERLVEQFSNIATDYLDEGEFLFAYFAFQKVQSLAEPAIGKMSEGLDPNDRVRKEKLEKLRQQLQQAKSEIGRIPERIESKDVKEPDLSKLTDWFEKGEYLKTVEPLTQALTLHADDSSLKEKLAKAQEQLALKRIESGELDEAYARFRKAAVLSRSEKRLVRHLRVINMFYDGSITPIDKDQWFFFFTG